jgi:threonine synthase
LVREAEAIGPPEDAPAAGAATGNAASAAIASVAVSLRIEKVIVVPRRRLARERLLELLSDAQV